MPRRVAIYLRVSTKDQTTENQRRELEVVAERAGWNVVRVFEDAGVSGSKGRDKRPAYNDLLKAVTRREVDLVAAWSVDRLGRSLQDLVSFLEELKGHGADLYLHQQALDTTTPSGRALFGMMAVFAEFERAMIVERVNVGLSRTRAKGTKLGRPTLPRDTEAKVRALRAEGIGILKVAKSLGIGVSAVQRIDRDMQRGATVGAVTSSGG
jgi:DNA invertase Pin-like site-specific DNA recombinase